MTRSKMKALFIVARKNRAHIVSIVSITAILDSPRSMSKSSPLSNDARGQVCQAQRTATWAHREAEVVNTPGRKAGAEEGLNAGSLGLVSM
jgi:hypothetical protein